MKKKGINNTSFNFRDLFIFEMSKNHGGDVEHGLKMVREFAEVVQRAGVRGAIKLQFRDLQSYIHPRYQKEGEERMRRYFSSDLSKEDFGQIVQEIKSHGMLAISTPFDEESVDLVDELGVEVIKIASSSAKDLPLLERVVISGKPIVCSTGGLRLNDIDALVEFLQNKGATFAILHCVGIYPTPHEYKQLNRIRVMKERYPGVPIGFSTHEHSDDFDTIQIAYAQGAELFEKHIALPNDTFMQDPSFKKVLAYAATPAQAEKWLHAYSDAVVMCGDSDGDYEPSVMEVDSLRSMVRGMYFRHAVTAGNTIERSDVYFAIPLGDAQLHSGQWCEGMTVDKDYQADEPVPATILNNP